jgi:hypothetical protein
MTDQEAGVPLYTWFEPQRDAAGAVVVGEGAALLGFDADAIWGRGADGQPLTLDQFIEAFCDIVQIGAQREAVLRVAPNNGAVPGTRVRYSDAAAFDRDFGNLGISILGPLSGVIAGVGGGSFSARSLPPRTGNAVELYSASVNPSAILPAGWSIEIAQTAPYYGGSGGAYQLVIFDEFDTPVRFSDPRIAETGLLIIERYEAGTE